MRERLRELDALPHAFAVRANLFIRHVAQTDGLDRALCHLGRRSFLDAIQSYDLRLALAAGHSLLELVLFRTESDAEVRRRVFPDRLAEHRDAPFARLQLTRDQ